MGSDARFPQARRSTVGATQSRDFRKAAAALWERRESRSRRLRSVPRVFHALAHGAAGAYAKKDMDLPLWVQRDEEFPIAVIMERRRLNNPGSMPPAEGSCRPSTTPRRRHGASSTASAASGAVGLALELFRDGRRTTRQPHRAHPKGLRAGAWTASARPATVSVSYGEAAAGWTRARSMAWRCRARSPTGWGFQEHAHQPEPKKKVKRNDPPGWTGDGHEPRLFSRWSRRKLAAGSGRGCSAQPAASARRHLRTHAAGSSRSRRATPDAAGAEAPKLPPVESLSLCPRISPPS